MRQWRLVVCLQVGQGLFLRTACYCSPRPRFHNPCSRVCDTVPIRIVYCLAACLLLLLQGISPVMQESCADLVAAPTLWFIDQAFEHPRIGDDMFIFGLLVAFYSSSRSINYSLPSVSRYKLGVASKSMCEIPSHVFRVHLSDCR